MFKGILVILRLLFFSALGVGFFSQDSSNLITWPLGPGTSWLNTGNGGVVTLLASPGAGNAPLGVSNFAGYPSVQFFGNSVGANDTNGILSNQAGTTTVGEIQRGSWKACFYPQNLGLGDYQTLITKRQALFANTPTTVVQTIVIDLNNTNDGVWIVGLATSPTVATYITESTNKVTTGSWQCVGFSYDGTTIRLYKDGIAAASGVAGFATLDYGAHGPWMVGGNKSAGGTGASNSVSGFMHGVAISSVVQPASWFVN